MSTNRFRGGFRASKQERLPILAAACFVLISLGATGTQGGDSTPSGITLAAPAVVGLTSSESDSCRAVLAEALKWGFPDLAGAEVVVMSLKIKDDQRVGFRWLHLHLADGSWLGAGRVPLAEGDVISTGQVLRPAKEPSGDSFMAISRLSDPDKARYEANAITGPMTQATMAFFDRGANVESLCALAWWLSGADPQGRALVALSVKAAATQGDTMVCLPSFTRIGEQDHGLVEVPGMAICVRRIVVRWYMDRLIDARNAEEGDRWVLAARAMLSEGDRPAWLPLIDRLRQRIDIAPVAPKGANLAARLASWEVQSGDLAMGRQPNREAVPATVDDTASLIGLLGDHGPARWICSDVPMTLGDVALYALNEAWRFDWRWISLGDAHAAACFPVKDDQGGRGDEWRLVETNWTDSARSVVSSSLATWWSHQDPADRNAPLLAALHQAPLVVWDEIIGHQEIGRLNGGIGDGIASLLAQIKPPIPNEPAARDAVTTVMRIALYFPAHPGITAALARWPAAGWLDNLAIMRAGLAGQEERLDRLFQEAFAHPAPRSFDNSDPWDGVASPWRNLGLIAHRPTPARLDMLRAVLGGEVTRAVHLLYWVGFEDYPLMRSFIMKDLPISGSGPLRSRIPAQLALDALEDHRRLNDDAVTQLFELNLSWGGSQISLSECKDPRVCDYVAARLLGSSAFGDTWRPPDVGHWKAYLSRPSAARDADLAKIRPALAAVVQRLLAAEPTKGAADF